MEHEDTFIKLLELEQQIQQLQRDLSILSAWKDMHQYQHQKIEDQWAELKRNIA